MSERFDDELLLQWLLNPEDRDEDARRELETDEAARARITELGGFLDRCRSVAEEGTAVDADQGASLRDRILSRTTREDLTWRGDLSLYARYLRGRLADSGWYRLAAASLLLHLLALPALAVYVFVTAPDPPEIGFITWEEYYPEGFPDEDSDEPLPALEMPPGDDLPPPGELEDERGR